MPDLSFDEVFGTDTPKPPKSAKTQGIDFFGGALKGFLESTLGGAVEMGKTFAKGVSEAGTNPEVPFWQRALESNPLFRPAAGIRAVGKQMAEGAVGQGQRAADLAMGVERGPAGDISGVGEAHPGAALAQVVPFVGPPAAEAILDPSAANVGRAVGNVAGTVAPVVVPKILKGKPPVQGPATPKYPGLSIPDEFLSLGQEARGTAHPFLAQVEATLAKTASGRPAFVKLKEAQNAVLTKAGADLAESFSGAKGSIRTGVGKDLVSDLVAAREGAFQVADKALTEVKAKHGTTRVSTDTLREWAKNELDRLGPVEEMIGNQHGEVRGMLQSIAENPNKTLSFSEAIDLRSALAAKGRKVMREGTEPRGGMVKQLTKTFDAAMDEAAKAGGFDVSWRDANKLWKNARDTFDRSFIKTISKKDPALISKALTKEMATPDNLALVKSKVSRATWSKVRGRLLEDALADATRGGELKGTSLRKWYDDLGAEKRDVIFDKADAASIEKLIDTAEAVGLHDVQGFGSWLDRVVTLGTGAATAIVAPGKLTAKSVVAGAAGFMGAKTAMKAVSKILADPQKARKYAGFMKDSTDVMKDLAKGTKPAPYAMQRFKQLQSQIQKDVDDLELDLDEVFKEN